MNIRYIDLAIRGIVGCLVLLSTSATAQNRSTEACFNYRKPSVAIEGRVAATMAKGPANPKVLSEHYAHFMLQLDSPICMDAGESNDGLEPGLTDQRSVELGVTTADEYRYLRSLLGKHVSCSGRLGPAIMGYQWGLVVLWSPVCSPTAH